MNEKKDYLEEIIKKELHNEAHVIEEEVDFSDASEGMSEEVKERIRENLKSQIAEYEREREEEAYPNLSEEDREALRLGREELRRRAEAEEKKTVVRKKRRVKWFVVLAAALVLTLGLGMNAFGSRERVAEFMRRAIGEREVTQVDSSGENKMIEEEDEEEAYDLVAQKLGVEPVMLVRSLPGMGFQEIEFDDELQLAELIYSYQNEKVVYLVNASYKGSSWGIDAEDGIVDEYLFETEKCSIIVTVHEILESNRKRCSAEFEYNGIQYYLIATMKQEEFDKILKNLHFF